MGVAFISTLTLRPSGTDRTISSARAVSPVIIVWAMGTSAKDTLRPSPRWTVSMCRSCTRGRSGILRVSKILTISRLKDTGAPVLASKTATPTGEVSIRVSRSVLARGSSWYRRALAMTRAAWEANITRVSSSSAVNSRPSSPLAR